VRVADKAPAPCHGKPPLDDLPPRKPPWHPDAPAPGSPAGSLAVVLGIDDMDDACPMARSIPMDGNGFASRAPLSTRAPEQTYTHAMPQHNACCLCDEMQLLHDVRAAAVLARSPCNTTPATPAMFAQCVAVRCVAVRMPCNQDAVRRDAMPCEMTCTRSPAPSWRVASVRAEAVGAQARTFPAEPLAAARLLCQALARAGRLRMGEETTDDNWSIHDVRDAMIQKLP